MLDNISIERLLFFLVLYLYSLLHFYWHYFLSARIIGFINSKLIINLE